MKAYERLLKYAVIRTPSDPSNSGQTPSSACQFELARVLEEEMKGLGLTNVHTNELCYVYGRLPATPGCENCPAIGFIAHLDTVADFCSQEIHPVITENYDGKDLPLGDSGRILSTSLFPHLTGLAGRTLITTDGHTILGADNKAGIAEILTMIEYFQTEDVPHGPVCVCFTPDEEIGLLAAQLDLEELGAKYAYTLDADTEGGIQYENFNACKASFEIKGVSVHPGAAKDTMVNASLVAMELNALLPGDETPRDSENYQGFYHLTDMTGDCGSAALNYIIRDHEKDNFEKKRENLRLAAEKINKKWGEGTVTLTITEQYSNMADVIADHMHLIDNARLACEKAGVKPLVNAIRGGTDGCALTLRGLPCPNLGTGGHGFHGPYEHVTVEGMDKCVDIIIEIVKLYAK